METREKKGLGRKPLKEVVHRSGIVQKNVCFLAAALWVYLVIIINKI